MTFLSLQNRISFLKKITLQRLHQLDIFKGAGTLYQWMLVSFLVVSLPLVFAIFYALNAMDNSAQQVRTTVFQTVTVTENSRLVLERLVSMERSIRQFQVLKEAPFLEAYLKHHQKLQQLMDVSHLKGLEPKLLEKLITFKQQELTLFDVVYQKAFVDKEPLSQRELAGYDALNKAARELVLMGTQQQAQDMVDLTNYETDVRNRLLNIIVGSTIVAIVLSIFFVGFITSPIKSLGLAMRHLVKEDFETPIPSAGPKDMQELGEHLEGLRQELKYLENEKQQFLRNVSHELKTPLATLKEGADLLSEELLGELTPQQKEVVQLMQLGNVNMLNLVENLLEYQKAVSMHAQLSYQRFELPALLNDLTQSYQLLLQSKSLTLHIECSVSELEADVDKLKMIVSNLLSNAIKFAPTKSHIRIVAKQVNDTVSILVEDQGDGIEATQTKTIFDAFFQGKASPHSAIKGTGLGLAIVGYYVAKLKGKITLLPATQDYTGARFALTLPMGIKK